MMDYHQLLQYVIVPSLAELGLGGKAAEQLVLGTAIQESNLRWICQVGGGPGSGLWQMEPATHADIWDNFLAYQTKLANVIRGPFVHPDVARLVYDLRYACQMCRVHYRRQSAPIPKVDDIRGQGEYWKRYYNTPLGAGTVDQYVVNWHKTVT